MNKVVKLYDNIANKFEKLVNLNSFWPIYTLSLALFSAIGWRFFSMQAMMLLILVAVIFLVFTDDMMYILPSATYCLFVISDGFSSEEFPIPIIVVAGLFLISLIIYTVFNGIKIKKLKSFYPLLLLAIINIIPIFWNNVIEKENSVFYFLYFASLGYFVLYLLFGSGLKKVNFKGVVYTFSFLGLLLTIQCGFKFIEYGIDLFNSGMTINEIVNTLFSYWYHLGWGLCNEAGIMICFSLPFTFYLLASSKTLKGLIGQTIMVLISLLGVLFTTSRGSYLCAAVISIASFIAMFFVGKNRSLVIKYNTSLLVIAVVVFLLGYKITFPLVEKVIDTVFSIGLDSNGRTDIWNQGFEIWTKNPLNLLLGPGIVSILEVRASGLGEQLVPLVFHSTLVETLAVGGLLAVIVLGWHLIIKFKILFKTNNKCLTTILFIGFLSLDLYGMIDNTYFMYYYMIPLMLLLSCLEVNDYSLDN